MSAWRLAVKALAARPGPARAIEVGDELGLSPVAAHSALREAREKGLTEQATRYHWRLTERGIAFVEGRVAMRNNGPHHPTRPGTQFVCTWLESLPRGLRINNEATPC